MLLCFSDVHVQQRESTRALVAVSPCNLPSELCTRQLHNAAELLFHAHVACNQKTAFISYTMLCNCCTTSMKTLHSSTTAVPTEAREAEPIKLKKKKT